MTTPPKIDGDAFIKMIEWHETFMPRKTVWRGDTPRWRQALKHLDDCLDSAQPSAPTPENPNEK